MRFGHWEFSAKQIIFFQQLIYSGGLPEEYCDRAGVLFPSFTGMKNNPRARSRCETDGNPANTAAFLWDDIRAGSIITTEQGSHATLLSSFSLLNRYVTHCRSFMMDGLFYLASFSTIANSWSFSSR